VKAEGSTNGRVDRIDSMYGQIVDIADIDAIMGGNGAPSAKSTMVSEKFFLNGRSLDRI